LKEIAVEIIGRYGVEIIGWYGMLATLVAYFLVSYALIKPRILFQMLNFTGAFGLGVIALEKKAYPVLALDIIWMGIALVAVIKIMFFKKSRV